MRTCRARVAHAINTSITQHLTALGHHADCPPLHWTVDLDQPGTVTGYAADYDEHQTGDVLTAWSHLLGLTWQNTTAPGTWRFAGQLGVLLIDVWGVTDRATFDNHTQPTVPTTRATKRSTRAANTNAQMTTPPSR
jgi:hypothetical protein